MTSLTSEVNKFEKRIRRKLHLKGGGGGGRGAYPLQPPARSAPAVSIDASGSCSLIKQDLTFKQAHLVSFVLCNQPKFSTSCFQDPFSLTVMHRGRFGLSWNTKTAIRVSSFSGGEICFHLNSLFML